MTAPPDSSPAPAAARPHAVKAQRQCQRILDAAEKCFIESGFHAATMARIAATAGVSPGLIYRYFENKSAIVRAIIERNLENGGGCRLVGEPGASQPLCETLLDVFECWRQGADPRMNAALMLELTAESTRNPALAQFIRSKDRVIGDRLAMRLRHEARAQGMQLTPEASRRRAVILQCLVEGLASRAVRDPTLRRQTLRPALQQVLAALLR